MTHRKRRIFVVAALLGLSCMVQAGLILDATVPGQDAVGFVRIAQKIDREGLLRTLRTEGQQPLFPGSVWLVHRGLEAAIGPRPSAWAASAQLAAAVPLVLALVPVYLIALGLVGPRAAVAGSLLFCVLPEVSRLGADGLSDSSHLLFFVLATWAVMEYLRGRAVTVRGSEFSGPAQYGSTAWLLVAGAATAAALLARVEVLVLPGALAAALTVFQFQRRRRQPWPRVVFAGGCFVLGFGVLFGPYLAAVGAMAPRAAVARALGTYRAAEDPASLPHPAMVTNDAAWELPDGRPMSFAYKEPSLSVRRRGYPAAVGMLAEELADAFGYWVGAFALFGLWRLRRTPSRRLDSFVQITFLLYCQAVLHYTAAEGYLSARHLVPLAAVGIGCAGYGLVAASGWLARRVSGGRHVAPGALARRPVRLAAAWAVVVAAMAACLAEQVQPLHASRRGHRAAGEWLAAEADASTEVLDTRGWTGLYSGLRTFGYRDAWAAFCDPRLGYVVLEQWELDYASDRSRTLKVLLERAGEAVATFPAGKASAPDGRSVVVYRWRPDRLSRRPAPHPSERTVR